MKITVEMLSKESETGYEYFIVENPVAVYIETEKGLSVNQDHEIPGYKLTELDKDDSSSGIVYYVD